MKRCVLSALWLICLPLAAVHADDLYHVTVGSAHDAQILRSSGVAPLLHSRQGYLILADSKTAAFLASSSVKAERLASDVTIDELAMDHRLDRANVGRYPLVFEENCTGSAGIGILLSIR